MSDKNLFTLPDKNSRNQRTEARLFGHQVGAHCVGCLTWQAEGMTIEDGFAGYWKKLLAKDPKLAAYPKSFQAQLREAYVEGFKHGSAERQIEIEEHKNTETFLSREEGGK